MQEHNVSAEVVPVATAQDLYKHVMRDLVSPRLRELGFRGSYTRSFWIDRGEYTGFFGAQKDRHNTKTEVSFWFHLVALHEATHIVYWQQELHWLMPGMTTGDWTVEVGSPPEPVAESVLDGFLRYGWPALQTALDPPVTPLGRQPGRTRQFPHFGDTRWEDCSPALETIAWALASAGRPADQWLADLNDHGVSTRRHALRTIVKNAADDSRTLPVLLDRLEHDPSPTLREDAARLLGTRAHDARIRQPLLDAAQQDQDVQVRWAASYALRLAGS
jgi:hypothetical protein